MLDPNTMLSRMGRTTNSMYNAFSRQSLKNVEARAFVPDVKRLKKERPVVRSMG